MPKTPVHRQAKKYHFDSRLCNVRYIDGNRGIGDQRGGATWGSCPPLEFENDDVICCSRGKYPKIFALAFGARIKYP